MIKGTRIVLREKKLDDAANDYAWRIDAELAYLDASTPLDVSFSEFLLGYADELHYANLRGHRYAIETLDGRHIGNCSYYNLNEHNGEAEIGILIGERAFWDKGYGADAIITLVNQIFREANLKRLYLHTLEWNTRAKKCFQKCGFVPCGYVNHSGRNFIIMEIKIDDYKKPSPNPAHN
ncbi:MAG TPA: GNAT family N-acetyltransferase [Dehalococcoidia bacterium]|nr:GNAT family N-acetyltransferase [Dehalococcoidia bacterium]